MRYTPPGSRPLPDLDSGGFTIDEAVDDGDYPVGTTSRLIPLIGVINASSTQKPR